MSKITPKNLSYSTSLPPFLQRIHADFSSSSSSGRHERPIARPKRVRTADDDAEDEPVYVDEETGEVVVVEKGELSGPAKAEGGGEGEGEGEGKREGGEGQGEEGSKGASPRQPAKEKLALIGAARKRKAGRIVGAEGDDGQSARRQRREDAEGDIRAAVAKAAALGGEGVVDRRLEKEEVKKRGEKEKGRKGGEGGKGMKREEGPNKKKKSKKVMLSFDDGEV